MYAKFNIRKVASFANISTISLVISTDLSTFATTFENLITLLQNVTTVLQIARLTARPGGGPFYMPVRPA